MQSTDDDYFDSENIKYLRYVHDRLAHQLRRDKERAKIDELFYKRQNALILVEKALACMGCTGHHNETARPD